MNLSRRDLLIDGLRVGALVPFAPGAAARALVDSGAADERVLVVVQLTGGNDGLNTVVPHGQDAYYRLRPFIGQKKEALHPIDDAHGLHPALAGLGVLAAEGKLGVIHGVGSPVANRSHFRSLEVWHTGDPDGPVGEVGWLGHLADQLAHKHPGALPALSVGGRYPVLSMRGRDVVPPTVPEDRGFSTAYVSRKIAPHRDALLAAGRPRDERVARLRESARTAYDAAARMQAMTEREGRVQYPDRPLSPELRLVARLIAGGFGTRIFHVSLSGFDTHSSQPSVHGQRMRELDGALAAFQRDLDESGVADRVTTFVFSEFGRRAAENGSQGTDHGAGAPALVLGNQVVGGAVGTPPNLDDLVEGDIRVTTDFRALYRVLSRDWMGLDPFRVTEAKSPRFLRV